MADEEPEQLDLIPNLSDIPAPVKRAANAYKKASEEKSQASSKFKGKKENLIALMQEHKVAAVPIDLGGVRKIIRLEDEPKIHLTLPPKPVEAEEK